MVQHAPRCDAVPFFAPQVSLILFNFNERKGTTRNMLAPFLWKFTGQDGVVPGTTRSALW